MSECHWCYEDMSDRLRTVDFGEFQFCEVCAYSIKDLEELRCEQCEEVITYICLIEEDAVGDGEGHFWCINCRDSSSEADSDSEEDESDDSAEEQSGPLNFMAANPLAGAVVATEARARNLRDMQRLKRAFPEYCCHHLLYYYVLQAPARGCTNQLDAAGRCQGGGRPRSHGLPDHLEDLPLEALGSA